jgi:hypothetical protein
LRFDTLADRNMMLTIDEYMAIRRLIGSERESEGATVALRSNTPTPKKKKRVSKYSREFGRQLKKLKVERPRTAITRLMKTAHTRTRKAMKKK